MRILKFLESIEFNELNSLLIDFEDVTEIKLITIKGINTFSIVGDLKLVKVSMTDLINEVNNLIKRVNSLGYENSKSNTDKISISGIRSGWIEFEFRMQFLDQMLNNEDIIIPDVNSFDVFKGFIEEIGIKFFSYDSEIYLPNNDKELDLMVSISDDEEIFQIFDGVFLNNENGNPNLNWSVLNKDDEIFMRSIMITEDEYMAHRKYSEDGTQISSWITNPLPKDRVKELRKSYDSKCFKFDKKGLEIIIKVIKILNNINGPILLGEDEV